MTAGGRLRPAAGADVLPEGVRFRVWAPRVRSLALKLLSPREALVPMTLGDDGVYEALVPGIGAGAEYTLMIDGERARPDPRSRWQPRGVHGRSRVVDPGAFRWTDGDYRAPAMKDLVIYELHTGTFTREGTFSAIRPRLRRLSELGVTAVELMPVAEFPGGRNWGYDGVGLFAPSSAYGGPEALRELVNACHAAGMAVLLDVVYNHLGPEGNYLAEFGPYFTDRHRTPWGDAVNYDGAGSDGVRRFIIDNAVSWLTEYHIDGLRLDAVHGIFDMSATHVLEELTAACHAEARALGREACIIAESDLNDPRVVRPVCHGGLGLDAQWSDDFHHSVHTLLTGERRGYFVDFGRVSDLGKAVERGFVYDGRHSAHRERRHGRAAQDLDPGRLVVYTQNHDQVANGSCGVRHAARLPVGDQAIAALLLLTAPGIPLLFMGQEYGETAPFHYFTSHGDADLARAVSSGRREELRAFGWGEAFRDPQDPATFEASKLTAFQADSPPHASIRRLYQDLLRLRRERPAIGRWSGEGQGLLRVETSESPRWILVERADPGEGGALVIVNFEPEPAHVPVLSAAGPRWTLALWTGDPRYGGPAGAPRPLEVMDMDAGALARLTVPGRTGLLYLQSDGSGAESA